MKHLVFTLFLVLMGAVAMDENISVETNSSTMLKEDHQNFSLALSERNLKYCSAISNKDKKIECFGIVKRNSGYCDMIENSDLKNICLSVALSDPSLCNKVENEETKNECKDLER